MAILHILGSGTCFPEPGRVRRAHPGFLLKYGDKHLLFECSASIAERLEQIGVRPDDIHQMAISHAHPDHFALPQFLQSAFCAGLTRVETEWTKPHLRLYVPVDIAQSIEPLLAIHFPETAIPGQKPGLDFPTLEIASMAFKDGVRFCKGLDGGAKLEAFDVYHGFGRMKALAFRVELASDRVLAYSGDSGMCDRLVDAAREADIFLCEAAGRIGDRDVATKYGHLTPYDAGLIARKAKARLLVLTHYTGYHSDDAMIADARRSEYKGEIIIGKDGMQIEL